MNGGNFGSWPGMNHEIRAPRMGSRLVLGLPGALSNGKEHLPHCACGGQLRFDTDQIGRSMACCDRCERVLPLADVPDPVLD